MEIYLRMKDSLYLKKLRREELKLYSCLKWGILEWIYQWPMLLFRSVGIISHNVKKYKDLEGNQKFILKKNNETEK